MSHNLPDDIHSQVVALSATAEQLVKDGKPRDALEKYDQALALLPEPKLEWEAATWLLTAIGDVRFSLGEHSEALKALSLAVRAPGGLGNPFVHLRLGQARYELGGLSAAADELARAYMGGGSEIFDDEDPKYWQLVSRTLQLPH